MSSTTETPARIEREVEQTRAELSGTLDALRGRLDPAQIVDQVANQAMDYVRGSGGQEFARNLGTQLRDNPMPVLLIGAGIAWMMMGGAPRARGPQVEPEYGGERWTGGHGDERASRRWTGPDSAETGIADRAGEIASRARVRVMDVAGVAGEAASGAASAVGDAASAVGDAVSRAADTAGDAASRVVGAVGDAASRAGEALTGGAGRSSDMAYRAAGHASDSASRGYGEARDGVSRGLERLAADQPLMFGALGLALGAALGAILPRTQAEDELMGEARDRLAAQASAAAGEAYGQAREVAGERIEQAKAAVGQTYVDAKERLERDGLGGVGETLSGAAQQARDAVRDTAEQVRRGLEADRPA